MAKKKTNTKRVFVTLPRGISDIIDRDFKKMGETDSEIVRSMIISYLNLRGYFVNSEGFESALDFQEKIDVLEKMIESLTELLEQKGTINYTQWESILNEKLSGTPEK